MSEKIKNIINVCIAVVFFGGLLFWCMLRTPQDVSIAERRNLKKAPKLTISSVFSDNQSFMYEFEKYAADQFPMREYFRKINSVSNKYILGRKEVNDLFTRDGYISKLEYEINQDSVEWSLNRMNFIKDKYLSDNKIYLAIIPDKNYYLCRNTEYPCMDYDRFVEAFIDGTKEYATYIDLFDKLSLKNYYYTDTHWRQETLLDIKNYILKSMGPVSNFYFEQVLAKSDFEGVYYGQLALGGKKDVINYLIGDYIDNLVVKCMDTGKEEIIGVYDFDKLNGLDSYEMFLSGSKALITIENPLAKSKRELVLFRDSFGSSIAPLLAGEYSKITLVDIRYINPAMLGKFVVFDEADILFLYSTQVLNNSVGQFIN